MRGSETNGGGPLFAAVITAAGASARMGGIKKEYASLGRAAGGENLTVLGAAALAIASSVRVSLLAIAVPNNAETGEYAARRALPQSLLENSRARTPPLKIIFVPGGSSRRASVFHALCALKVYAPDYVLIHDGARPWLDGALINRLLEEVVRYPAVLPVTGAVETPKELDEDGFVCRHLKRSSIALAQTPQAFAFEGILRAHELAEAESLALPAGSEREYTDDAEIWGTFSGRVKTIEGSKANVKITFPEDLPRPDIPVPTPPSCNNQTTMLYSP